jgi:hypothetical protein
MESVHYTAHYNWAWVVTAALDELKQALSLKEVTLCERFRDLPSNQQSAVKSKATYSLFRLDWADPSTKEIRMVRTRSDIFGFLDPKDSLARICQLLSVSKYMPDTLLIPYNWVAPSDQNNSGINKDGLRGEIARRLRTGPKLLKAPLGSGGFGLYFVYSVHGKPIVLNAPTGIDIFVFDVRIINATGSWHLLCFTHCLLKMSILTLSILLSLQMWKKSSSTTAASRRKRRALCRTCPAPSTARIAAMCCAGACRR